MPTYSIAASTGVSALNEMARVNSRPSSSGSTTCMARSLGARPRSDASHAALLVPARATCSTGTVGGIEHGRVVRAPRREGRRVDDDRRTPRGDQRVDHLRRRGILEAGERDGGRVETFRRQLPHQRAHRGDVVGEQAGAIEDDECRRRARPCADAAHCGHRSRFRRRTSGSPAQRYRCRRLERLSAHERRRQPQRVADVAGAALAEVCVEQGRPAPADTVDSAPSAGRADHRRAVRRAWHRRGGTPPPPARTRSASSRARRGCAR